MTLETAIRKKNSSSTLLHVCEAFEIDLKEFFNSQIFKNVIEE